MPDESSENKKPGRSPQKTSRERARISSPLTLLLLTVCLVQFFLLAKNSRTPANPPVQPSFKPLATTTNPAEPYFHGRAGPWGDLEFARISIEPPDAFIPSGANFFGPTRWFFEGYTPEQLREFFGQCGLTAAQLAALTNAATWSVKTDGILVTPADETVLDLSEPMRQKIYSILARSQDNTLQLWPFKTRAATVDEWFANAGLSSETLALVKKLTYHRGDYLCFSDICLVWPRISTPEERQRLIKRLARTPSLLMKLRVTPHTDVDALADYWATGPRNKDIEALLDSLTNFPDGMTIDVAHLLPAFARKHLYTFPLPPTNSAADWPDCNWTAFNFFNDPPDDRFYDFDFCGNVLDQNYTKVKQARFGDLIVFYRPDGEPIHVVVYIADDVVFTKNGNSTFHPWTLMKWDDLILDYTLDYSPTYIIFHPKQPEQ